MIFLHFRDWDTLAYWITAIATVGLFIVTGLLASFAYKALDSWKNEQKHKIYLELYSTFLDFALAAYNYNKGGETELNNKHELNKYHKIFLKSYFKALIYLSKEINELFCKYSNKIIEIRNFHSDEEKSCILEEIKPFITSSIEINCNNPILKQMNKELGIK